MEHGTCADCGAATYRRGNFGPHPKRCTDCAPGAARVRARRHEGVTTPEHGVCVDCDAPTYRQNGRGFHPERCPECIAVHRRTRNYECRQARFAINPQEREDRRAASAQWYADNAEQSRAAARAWYYANTERARATAVAWRRSNLDRLRASNKQWREANHDAFLANVKRNKAVRRNAECAPGAERFAPAEIFDRDGWLCWLCSEDVPRDAKWPDPLSPSLDHVVPLSRRGTHTRANVRLAHLVCNIRRGAGPAD